MEATTLNFLGAGTRIIQLCGANVLIVDSNEAFKDGLTAFTAKKVIADALGLKLEWKTSGITIENTKLKKEISFKYSITCSAISALGDKTGDGKLSSMKIYTETALFETPKEQFKIAMSNILDVVDTNKTPLLKYKITPAFILELKALQTSYDADAFAPKNAIDAHKVTKGLLDTEVVEMKVILISEMDKPGEMFRLDDVEFYNLYRAARKVPHHHIHDKSPITPTATTGVIALTTLDKETGLPLSGVEFTILSINFIAYTDANGELAKDKLIPGEYEGTLTLAGKAPVNVTFTIVKGEITDLGFMMEGIQST